MIITGESRENSVREAEKKIKEAHLTDDNSLKFFKCFEVDSPIVC